MTLKKIVQSVFSATDLVGSDGRRPDGKLCLNPGFGQNFSGRLRIF